MHALAALCIWYETKKTEHITSEHFISCIGSRCLNLIGQCVNWIIFRYIVPILAFGLLSHLLVPLVLLRLFFDYKHFEQPVLHSCSFVVEHFLYRSFGDCFSICSHPRNLIDVFDVQIAVNNRSIFMFRNTTASIFLNDDDIWNFYNLQIL